MYACNKTEITCNPIRYHTKRWVSQNGHSKRSQPWHRRCLTCIKHTIFNNNFMHANIKDQECVGIMDLWKERKMTENQKDKLAVAIHYLIVSFAFSFLSISLLNNKIYLLSPTKSVETTSSSVYPKIPLSLPSDSSLKYNKEKESKIRQQRNFIATSLNLLVFEGRTVKLTW